MTPTPDPLADQIARVRNAHATLGQALRELHDARYEHDQAEAAFQRYVADRTTEIVLAGVEGRNEREREAHLYAALVSTPEHGRLKHHLEAALRAVNLAQLGHDLDYRHYQTEHAILAALVKTGEVGR